jgi:hypothetical protein
VIEDLRSLLGAERVLTEPDVLVSRARDSWPLQLVRAAWTRPPAPVDDQTTLENGSTPVSEVLTLDGPGGRQR